MPRSSRANPGRAGRTPGLIRGIPRLLTGLLTMVAVATTLATSQEPGPHLVATEAPLDIDVWNSTTVLGKDESSVHLFLSLPTDLLDDHESAMSFDFVVWIDQLEEGISPQTAWAIRVGDSMEDTVSFSSSLVDAHDPGETPFHVWDFVDSFGSDDILISSDCDENGCIPCDTTLSRCDVMLTLTRDAVTLPRMRVDVQGIMKQLDGTGQTSDEESGARRERF